MSGLGSAFANRPFCLLSFDLRTDRSVCSLRSGDIVTTLSLPFTQRRALPRPLAFALLSSIILALLASSSAPTPLYATYQSEWGFSPVTITVIIASPMTPLMPTLRRQCPVRVVKWCFTMPEPAMVKPVKTPIA